jgi:hypothetical protein
MDSVSDPDSDPDSDKDQDPAIFVINLQNANKKLFFLEFFCLLLFEGIFASFFIFKKVKKMSSNSRNQGSSSIFAY